MAAKLTRMTHKIAIQLHLVADSCSIRSSSSRRPVRKLLDTLSYIKFAGSDRNRYVIRSDAKVNTHNKDRFLKKCVANREILND
jgi:uncharacterized protein YPO0396